jgi:type VI protein secretion system component VasF
MHRPASAQTPETIPPTMTHTHRSPTPLSTLDTTRIDDTRIKAVRPLVTPALLQEWMPAPESAQALVESSRAAISRILQGLDDRLIVVGDRVPSTTMTRPSNTHANCKSRPKR